MSSQLCCRLKRFAYSSTPCLLSSLCAACSASHSMFAIESSPMLVDIMFTSLHNVLACASTVAWLTSRVNLVMSSSMYLVC